MISTRLQQQVRDYDELAMCLTNVRQQARAIDRRDRIEVLAARVNKVSRRRRFAFTNWLAF